MTSLPNTPPAGNGRKLEDIAAFSASPLAVAPASPIPYSKVINDPIHGHIELPDYCMHVVDTVQFQRLRDLKQLGSAYFVFPGASHNRFEHSIGVCYLAGVLVEHLRKQQPELGITDQDVKCVMLAGLCHDLGHGPFSHIFDNEFMKEARPGLEWTHEKASEDMLEYLVEDNDHVHIEAEEMQFIKDLIHGEPRSRYPQASKLFLFDIVANKRNSVDVDKFDYIPRDCHNVGVKSSFDVRRLMAFTRVINNQICFHEKQVFDLYELFHTRFSLFKRIYTHKVGKAAEYMITEALLAADKNMGIASSVDDMTRYVYLTDAIIKEIERSTSPELEAARTIIKRIRKRDLYRFVDQILVPLDAAKDVKEAITASAIVGCQNAGDDVKESDVIIEWLKLGYAMKDRNPVDLIQFFNKWHPNVAFPIKREHVSSFIPASFEEITLRVFARDNEKRLKIQRAFRQLIQRLNSGGAMGILETGQGGFQSTCAQRLFENVVVDTLGPSPDRASLRSLASSLGNVGSAQTSPMRLLTSDANLLPPNYSDISSPARKRKRDV